MIDLNKIEYWNDLQSHAFCGESILTPNANKTDCNRLQMFTNNIMQCVQIEGASPPRVFSGFENQIGKYSSGYKFLQGEWKVIKKIFKNKYNYILIIYNESENIYDILFRVDNVNLTEHFGYKNKNKVIDKLKEGDIVKNKVLYRNMNYDSYMNFQYGTNLNAVYLPYNGYTNEDAIVISETTAKKMSSYFVSKIKVNINTNDLLCNIYGDNENYKSFPDIGEDIENKILLARRRINYNNNIYNLKDLNVIKEDDEVIYLEGKITDINVYCNFDLEKMKNQEYNNQVYKYIMKNRKYYSLIVEAINEIRKENKTAVYTQTLIDEYKRALNLSDDNVVLVSEGKKFDNYIIEFTVLNKEPLKIGSKLTGRMGNKGVVSLILPDDEMPEIETIDGEKFIEDETNPIKKRVDIVLNPSGIINRLNPSQLFEMELNFVSQIIRYRMSKMDNTEDKWNYLYQYMQLVNKREAEEMKEFYSELDKEEQEKFIDENIKNGIYINQEPFFNNINISDLQNIYDTFDIKKYGMKDIVQDLIVGELYYMRLKHDPNDKFSARSIDNTNFKDLPTKSRTFKDHKIPYSNTPIRIGKFCRILIINMQTLLIAGNS